jgi:hypothetical protein
MSEATELEYGRKSVFDVQCTELFVIILITIIITIIIIIRTVLM